MTPQQAEKSARHRWGKNAAVQYTFRKAADGTTTPHMMVGFIVLGMMFEVRGQGKTWEDAFTEADAKVKE